MIDAEDLQGFATNPIGDNIGGAGNDEFPRAGHTTWSPDLWCFQQHQQAGDYFVVQGARNARILGGDVPIDVHKVVTGLGRPNNLHRAASCPLRRASASAMTCS